MSTSRVPAGVPAGGQFAEQAKGEAEVELGAGAAEVERIGRLARSEILDNAVAALREVDSPHARRVVADYDYTIAMHQKARDLADAEGRDLDVEELEQHEHSWHEPHFASTNHPSSDCRLTGTAR